MMAYICNICEICNSKIIICSKNCEFSYPGKILLDFVKLQQNYKQLILRGGTFCSQPFIEVTFDLDDFFLYSVKKLSADAMKVFSSQLSSNAL